jgi:hypothetical protein
VAMYWTMAWSTVTEIGLNSQGRGNAPFAGRVRAIATGGTCSVGKPYAPEQGFQVIRELAPPRVPRVHGDEHVTRAP